MCFFIYINKSNGLTEQTYLYIGNKDTRDLVESWIYPIHIDNLRFANTIGISYVSARLLQYSIISIDLTTNTITGHWYGYNASTPVNQYGFIIQGY